MFDALITYIFVITLFLVLGIYPSALAFFIVKKISKKNKIAIITSVFVAIIDFLTYIIFISYSAKPVGSLNEFILSIIELLIYHFLFALITFPSLSVFYMVKSFTNKTKPAIITSLFVLICICLSLYAHIQNKKISNTVIILNHYDKMIYVNKILLGNEIIFQGKYL